MTPQVPELLQATFGGHLGRTKATAINGRDLIGWTATALKASAACEALLPYLRIKRAQAGVLIELQDRKKFGGRARVTDAELAERDRLALLVQSMNKVGV